MPSCAQIFNVDSGRTAYIGDMVSDIEAGRDAGTTTVAVTWGAGKREALAAAKPDHLIDDPLMLRMTLQGIVHSTENNL